MTANTAIIDMTNKVITNLAMKYQRINEEVGRIMVGPVLDYEAKDILNKGRREGWEKGRQEGRILERIEILRDLGKSEDEIIQNVIERFKITPEEARKYLESEKNMN